MAIYLGNKFGGVTNLKYIQIDNSSNSNPVVDGRMIGNAEYESLKNSVEYRTGTLINSDTIDILINKLQQEYMLELKASLLKYSFNTTWSRPNEWPNLDSLNLQYSGNNDFIYMTYDTTKGTCAIALHVEAKSGGTPITVTVGHITNGSYYVDETLTGTSNNYVKWYTTNSGYPVVRVTGSIAKCYSYAVSANNITQEYKQSPIVERIAYVPNLTHLVTPNNYNSQAWGVRTLQREKIVNGAGTALLATYYAWSYCRNLQSLDISGLYTPNVTNMIATFLQCLQLKTLDLQHWNVTKVTSIQSMFENCRALTTLNLTGWTTSALTNLYSTFNSCFSLQTIPGISNFNTSLVTTFYNTFSNCRALRELNLTSWNTSKVNNLYQTFYSCYGLIQLDLSNWDVSLVTNCGGTFGYCRSLKLLNINGWNLTKLTTISGIFRDCISLQSIDLSGFHINTNCTNIYNAFGYCVSLKELHFPNWDVSNVSASNNTANSLFSNCWSLTTITGISNWNFSTLSNSLASMFEQCRSLKSLDISGWNVSNATSFASMFSNCWSLEELNLSSWTTTNCTTFASMFAACYSLKTIGNISNWNTAKVTTFASMFSQCFALQTCPNISTWDVSNVTTIASMFNECTSLKEVTIQNWTLTKCTTMATMFRYCYRLEKINLSGWTFPAMTTAPATYLGDCWNLRDIEGISIPPLNVSFAGDENLSYNSIQTILNALPVTTTARTVNLSALNNNRLTADQRTTIKNTKNWTVSA